MSLGVLLVALLAVAVPMTTAQETDEVCFDFVGCFSMGSPWKTLLRPLPTPASPKDIQTRFYLYTRTNARERYYVQTRPEVSLENSYFNGEKPTFFVTHGFSSDGNASWVDDMKNALLDKVDGNVIVVDWGKGASTVNYLQVSSNTRVVAAEAIRVIRYMLEKKDAKPALLHIIGHSLGAQISSYIAKGISGVGRLTALDPAQPYFEQFDQDVRLDESDAVFVEVLHTDAKPIIPLLGFGTITPSGDVDFYVNGGFDQPGCTIPMERPNITSLLDLARYPVEVIANFVTCPHSRAYLLFTAALKNPNCTFWGHPLSVVKLAAGFVSRGFTHKFTTPNDHDCNIRSCIPMSYDSILYPARGSFVVPTTGHPPYCIPEPEVDKKMADELKTLQKNGGKLPTSLLPNIHNIPVINDVVAIPSIFGKLLP